MLETELFFKFTEQCGTIDIFYTACRLDGLEKRAVVEQNLELFNEESGCSRFKPVTE